MHKFKSKKCKQFLTRLLLLCIKLVPSGIPFKILRGPLKGKKVIIGAPAGDGKGISVIFNLSEPRRLKQTRDLILRDDVCFDIGANVGIYSLLFSEYSRITYAFEPLPRNLSFLYRMLECNKIKNVVIVPSAVSDIDGLAWFETAESNAEGRLTKIGTLPVVVVALDTFIKKSNIHPSLLKIDVEGSEFFVLKGARVFLEKSKPTILLETHGDELRNECFNFLKKLKYKHFEPIDAKSIEEANDFIIRA